MRLGNRKQTDNMIAENITMLSAAEPQSPSLSALNHMTLHVCLIRNAAHLHRNECAVSVGGGRKWGRDALTSRLGFWVMARLASASLRPCAL